MSKQNTGSSVDYYKVQVDCPTTAKLPYTVECNDIIEALGMSFAEGNAFKAIWRAAAERTLGVAKANYDGAVYDAEKVVFFANRMLQVCKQRQAKGSTSQYVVPSGYVPRETRNDNLHN
jgi:hypothetical protein